MPSKAEAESGERTQHGSAGAAAPAGGTYVTPLGALGYCSVAFGAAVLVVSAFAYRRSMLKLKGEGFTDEDVHKAMPYAAQAIGIATACVGGAGLAATGLVYASGVEVQERAQVSSVQDALRVADQMGSSVGSKLKRWGERNLWRLSDPDSGSSAGDAAGEGPPVGK